MNQQKPKIILDTDPGGDDAFAFLWLLSLAKQGFLELVAVTSADGNVHARLTFVAATKLLRLGGANQIEVGRGVLGGSQTTATDAAFLHGADGMGNLSHTLPDSNQTYETARLADDLLIAKLQEMPGEITIVAVAPLTNLAAAERKAPGILQFAKEIVIMGGAFHVPGNLTPTAEFNLAYDPEAAQQVFDRGHQWVLIPLDLTHQLIFTEQMAAAVAAVNPESPIAQFVVNLCQFMTKTALMFRETGGIPGFLVHDAATVAYLCYPETLSFRRAQVQIETQGNWTRGKTLSDDRHKPKVGANAWVGVTVDAPHLLAALVEDIKYLIRD